VTTPIVDIKFELKIFASQKAYGLESEIYSREIDFIQFIDQFKAGSSYVNGSVIRRSANQGT
jgi:hypothetical protein